MGEFILTPHSLGEGGWGGLQPPTDTPGPLPLSSLPPLAVPLPDGRGWGATDGGGKGLASAPPPHFLEAPVFLIKWVPGLLRKGPRKPCLAEGSRVGLGASTSPCARREPRCLGREGGLLPGADLSPAIIPAGERDGAGSRIYPWQGLVGERGGGVTLPPCQHGKGVSCLPWQFPATPVPPVFPTSSQAETCELMTGMARCTKGAAAPGTSAEPPPGPPFCPCVPAGGTGRAKTRVRSKVRGWSRECTQLRVLGQERGGSAVALAGSMAQAAPGKRHAKSSGKSVCSPRRVPLTQNCPCEREGRRRRKRKSKKQAVLMTRRRTCAPQGWDGQRP